jgi:biotin operon repressor
MTIKQLNFLRANSDKMTSKELSIQTGLSTEAVRDAQKRYKLPMTRSKATLEGYVPQALQLRIIGVARLICKNPCTAETIANTFNISKRSVYRYMAGLKDLGMNVEQDNKGRFSVSECPLCRKPIAN